MNNTIFTLTSLPNRILNIWLTIQSLLNQSYKPDLIYLNLPIDNGKKYNIPDLIKENPKIKINYCQKDWGPGTKLLATLHLIPDDPNTRIITFDDDFYYSPDLVKRLIEYSEKYPNSAIGFNGWNVENVLDHGFVDSEFIGPLKENLPQNVDVLEGYKGILYKRSFFDEKVFDYSEAPDEAKYVDDVWFSGYLYQKGISRLVIPILNRPLTFWEEWNKYWRPLSNSNIEALHSHQDKTYRNQIVAQYLFINKLNSQISTQELISFDQHKVITYTFIIYSPYEDEFEFYINNANNQLITKRLDKNEGWGQNLIIKFKSSNDNISRKIIVGPSEENIKIVNLGFNNEYKK